MRRPDSLVAELEPLPACRAGEQERPDLHGLEMGAVVGAYRIVHSCRVGMFGAGVGMFGAALSTYRGNNGLLQG
jgi:hypothetical protein